MGEEPYLRPKGLYTSREGDERPEHMNRFSTVPSIFLFRLLEPLFLKETITNREGNQTLATAHYGAQVKLHTVVSRTDTPSCFHKAKRTRKCNFLILKV